LLNALFHQFSVPRQQAHGRDMGLERTCLICILQGKYCLI
jgi:hypothetical protein